MQSADEPHEKKFRSIIIRSSSPKESEIFSEVAPITGSVRVGLQPGNACIDSNSKLVVVNWSYEHQLMV